MKKLLALLAFFSTMLFIVSCGGDDDDDDDGTIIQPQNETLTGSITEDMTLTSDRIWILEGRVIVTGGATLTIEAGTIIKGDADGTGSNAAVLMIARDGKINAVGTATEPIIFTSTDDNIAVGELKGTNLSVTDNQLWGGLVLLGNAPISVEAGTSAQIEGVVSAETLGQYGGSESGHSSGTLSYISIRHGGTTIDPVEGNDINGLTLGGVGSGTNISNIEIFANFDDGVEFFGGTVNVTNLLVYGVGDDGIDIDQAYSGTVNNFMVFTSEATTSDEGLEIDGPEGAENATGKFTLENGTITSVDGGGSGADFKSKAQGLLSNVKWTGFEGGSTIKFRASYNDDDCSDKSDAFTNLVGDDLELTTVEFGAITVYTDSEMCEIPEEAQTEAEGKVTSATASGVSNASAFDNWSNASLSDLL